MALYILARLTIAFLMNQQQSQAIKKNSHDHLAFLSMVAFFRSLLPLFTITLYSLSIVILNRTRKELMRQTFYNTIFAQMYFMQKMALGMFFYCIAFVTKCERVPPSETMTINSFGICAHSILIQFRAVECIFCVQNNFFMCNDSEHEFDFVEGLT